MSSDELDTRPHPREDVNVLRLPHSDLNRTVAQLLLQQVESDLSVVAKNVAGTVLQGDHHYAHGCVGPTK